MGRFKHLNNSFIHLKKGFISYIWFPTKLLRHANVASHAD